VKDGLIFPQSFVCFGQVGGYWKEPHDYIDDRKEVLPRGPSRDASCCDKTNFMDPQ
jgi:hypothetical protein